MIYHTILLCTTSKRKQHFIVLQLLLYQPVSDCQAFVSGVELWVTMTENASSADIWPFSSFRILRNWLVKAAVLLGGIFIRPQNPIGKMQPA
jgi:hypothetical protein